MHVEWHIYGIYTMYVLLGSSAILGTHVKGHDSEFGTSYIKLILGNLWLINQPKGLAYKLKHVWRNGCNALVIYMPFFFAYYSYLAHLSHVKHSYLKVGSVLYAQ